MRFLIIVFTSLFFLAGCTAQFLEDGLLVADGEKISLADVSYAAADILVQQSSQNITHETPLAIGALIDINNPSSQAPFGRIIAGHVGARFVQLGHKVRFDPSNMMVAGLQPAYGGSSFVSQVAAGAGRLQDEEALIAGYYVQTRRELLVNLRIVESRTGRILGAYDYSLPLNSDIRKLITVGGEEEEIRLFGF